MKYNVLWHFAPRLGTCVGCITLSPQGNLPTIKAANIQLAFRLSGVFPLSSPMMFVSTNKSNTAFLLRSEARQYLLRCCPIRIYTFPFRTVGSVVLATDCKSSAFSAPLCFPTFTSKETFRNN